MNKKSIFFIILSLITFKPSISFGMNKAKLALGAGLGIGSYLGWDEYKRWTGQQPSPAVQSWIKNTLKSQGVTDAEFNKVTIELLDDIYAKESPFSAMKNQIKTSISHKDLRKAQYSKLGQVVNKYIDAIQGKYNAIAESCISTSDNDLAWWDFCLAHEWAHIKNKDHKKTSEYRLKKEVKSLSQDSQSIPRFVKIAVKHNNQELLDSLSKISPGMKNIIDETQALDRFADQVLLVQNKLENIENAKDINEIIELPQCLKIRKEFEQQADQYAIEVCKNDPEKLWAAAIKFQYYHNLISSRNKTDKINIFDKDATNKKPTMIEELENFAHPTMRERAFYFADAARRAERFSS